MNGLLVALLVIVVIAAVAGGAWLRMKLRVEGGNWSPAQLDRTSEFFHGFFSRVPDFTWQELRAWPRPIAEIEDYRA